MFGNCGFSEMLRIMDANGVWWKVPGQIKV
jgi:hypothetical protein